MRGERRGGIIRRRLRDGSLIYYIDYRDAAGRRHQERVGPSYRMAVRARNARLAAVAANKFNVKSTRGITLRQFVNETWRSQALVHRKPSTARGYEWMLAHHLLPFFGDWRLHAVTRAAVKAFIASKAAERHQSRAKRSDRENPDRGYLSRKTIVNLVALLSAILESAAVEYELLPANPIRGMLRKANFPQASSYDRRPAVLEPEDFCRAVEAMQNARPRRMVLFAALTGLRWGEQVALRIDEDCDFRQNTLHITRSFYRRLAQTPKTEQSVRDVPMSPIVRQILKTVPWTEGLVFSPDGTARIGEGSWLRHQWQKAQRKVGIARPIRWHHLRHQFVSLMIAADRDPLTIARQAGHKDAGFTMRVYAHLFRTLRCRPVEWPEDLVWAPGTSFLNDLVRLSEVKR